MNKIVIFSVVTSAGLFLTACGGSSGNAVYASIDKSKTTDKEATVIGGSLDFAGHSFKFDKEKPVIDFGVLPEGLSSQPYKMSIVEGDNRGNIKGKGEYKGTLRSYNQFYSVVAGKKDHDISFSGSTYIEHNPEFAVTAVAGKLTPITDLPTQGQATYHGKAFTMTRDNQNLDGTFDYSINFKDKTGKGSYTLDNKKTDLLTGHLLPINHKGKVDLGDGFIGWAESFMDANKSKRAKVVFAGKTSAAKEDKKSYYVLGLYGPKAEEIAGVAVNETADIHDQEIGLGGKRGEITQ